MSKDIANHWQGTIESLEQAAMKRKLCQIILTEAIWDLQEATERLLKVLK